MLLIISTTLRWTQDKTFSAHSTTRQRWLRSVSSDSHTSCTQWLICKQIMCNNYNYNCRGCSQCICVPTLTQFEVVLNQFGTLTCNCYTGNQFSPCNQFGTTGTLHLKSFNSCIIDNLAWTWMVKKMPLLIISDFSSRLSKLNLESDSGKLVSQWKSWYKGSVIKALKLSLHEKQSS